MTLQTISQMSRNIKILLYSFGGILLLLGVFLGLQNSYDPYWGQLDVRLKSEFHTIDDTVLMHTDFCKIQKDHQLHNTSITNLFTQKLGYYPTMEYEKFRAFVEPILSHSKITILGIPGTGNTTLIGSLGRFISASPDRELEILCAPGLEVKMNEKYVGVETKSGFEPGILIEFIEKAKRDSLHNYVVTIDNIDKISPESFYGPELWNELEDEDNNYSNTLGDYELLLPDNLYLISVAHSGITAEKTLTDEHYRRIGNLITNYPSETEYIIYLRGIYEDGKIDYAQFKKLVYFFSKTNAYLTENYSVSHTIGQWGSIRKMYKPDDFNQLVETVIANTNTFKPTHQLRYKDIDHIIGTIENDGLVPESNFITVGARWIVQLGFFTEFLTGLIFLISTSVIGKYLIKRKKNKISNLINEFNQINEKEYLSSDSKKLEINKLTEKTNQMFLDGKINISEANYIQSYIRNRMG